MNPLIIRFQLSLIVLVMLAALPVISQPASFEEADRHALSAPHHVQQDTRLLADYLTSPFSSDADKARAIFRWVTEHISYDTGAFFASARSHESPDDVLRHRTAVCSGYALLFAELAGHAGIETEIIRGYSRGYGTTSGDDIRSNHAWVGVRTDGNWKLVDPTWGAGYIDRDSRRFVRKFNEHYFFTPPEKLIFDHFPDNPEWQLLSPPLTKAEYRNQVLVRPAFFEHKLKMLNQTARVIETSGSGVIELEVPESSILSARMLQGSMEVPTNQVLVHHYGEKGIVEFYPPQRGSYELQIYVREKQASTRPFEWAMSYDIRNNREHADSGFPEVFGRFLEHRSMLNQPRSYLLEAGTDAEFSIHVPGARAVTVVNNENWADLSGNDSTFTGTVSLEQGSVQVAARFPGSDTYHVLLQYVAR